MNIYRIIGMMLVSLWMGISLAEDGAQPSSKPPAGQGHGPPPHAYTDCQGKRAGDVVQHQTREESVSATCEDSPQGLVARPVRGGGAGDKGSGGPPPKEGEGKGGTQR